MNREVELINYLPNILRGYEEYKVITNAEDPEFKIIFDISEKVRNNMFIKYCNLDGIKRYEKLLGIRPSIKDTLEDRKFRVLSRWNDGVPYTWKVLVNKLDMLFGEDNYKLQLFQNNYTLSIEINTFNLNEFNEIIDELKNMIPANLVLQSTLVQRIKSPFCTSSTLIAGEEITVYPYSPRNIESKGSVYIATGSNAGLENVTIYPRKEVMI
jgi:hypothetical protein